VNEIPFQKGPFLNKKGYFFCKIKKGTPFALFIQKKQAKPPYFAFFMYF